MAEIWDQNEEIDENEELVVTDLRDEDESVDPEDEQLIETPSGDPRLAMDALGEDVSSSPARRGHDDPQMAARREDRER